MRLGEVRPHQAAAPTFLSTGRTKQPADPLVVSFTSPGQDFMRNKVSTALTPLATHSQNTHKTRCTVRSLFLIFQRETWGSILMRAASSTKYSNCVYWFVVTLIDLCRWQLCHIITGWHQIAVYCLLGESRSVSCFRWCCSLCRPCVACSCPHAGAQLQSHSYWTGCPP